MSKKGPFGRVLGAFKRNLDGMSQGLFGYQSALDEQCLNVNY
jgi:hypothetical protein